MLNGQQRGERKASNYLKDNDAIFRKHGVWLWYNEGEYPVYVPISFLHNVKTNQELQEKLKTYECGSGEMADTPA